ncbi:MAG TPA: agmatinase [Vicinamibacterales bacterium]|nr:agmatinase [Vicinamibacterales bacterium]
MKLPVEYDHPTPLAFGGLQPARGFDDARVVILPVPFERTTSYVTGTRNGPREILLASGQVELWDEETRTDVWSRGIFTLPEMELPYNDVRVALDEIRRVVGELIAHEKFLVVLGGEHSISVPVVEAFAARTPGLSVLQIDAHADLREAYQGSRFSHACAMRRILEHAPCTQVGIRSLCREESQAIPGLRTRVFWDHDMRQDPAWIDRVVEGLSETVYITIDADGLDPAIMPAVGTPEPGGLSWHETTALLRAVLSRRRVVGCDLVELSPLPGMVGPSFLCAKLIYKILSYRFAR